MNRREPILGLRSLSSGPVDDKSSLIRPPPACDPAPHRVGRRFVITSRKSRIAPWSVSACGRYGASTRHPTVSPNRPGSGGGSDLRKGGVMPAPRKYPNELGERARRMVAESMSEDPALTRNGAVKRIGPRVGAVPDTLSGWVKQAAIDAGQRPGVLFVDVRRARSGVAPICRVLSQHGVPIAPSTYYAARPRSARSVADEAMLAEVTRVHYRWSSQADRRIHAVNATGVVQSVRSVTGHPSLE